MKKRIISLITVFCLLLSLNAFTYATNFTTTIDNAKQYKTDYLSGNNLIFSANITGAKGATFSITGDALNALYYDSDIKFYTFTFNNLTVRANKNDFFDLNLKTADFILKDNSFNVTYTYKDTTTKKISQTNWYELRYTLTGENFSSHTVAVMNKKQINCTESTPEKFVFSTKMLGEFKTENFEFSDITDTSKWYYEYVNQAGAYGIVSGVGDGLFVPERNVTRAELATLIVDATKHIISYDDGDKAIFDDVQNKNSWYYQYVNKCAQAGLMSGIGNGLFNPTATATRQEIAEVTANVIRLMGSFGGKNIPKINPSKVDSQLKKIYTDSSEIHGWAKESVLLCNSLKIMEGSDGYFYPLRQITRAESAKIFTDIYLKAVI